MLRELGNISCDLDIKVKDQILFFLVDGSPLKSLDAATSNFVAEYITLCRGKWAAFCVTLGQGQRSNNVFYYKCISSLTF